MYFHRPIQNTSVFFKAHECLMLSHFSKSESVNYLKKIFAILLYIRVVASTKLPEAGQCEHDKKRHIQELSFKVSSAHGCGHWGSLLMMITLVDTSV